MTITVAACGWLGEAWAPFYPEGMPQEWRFDYYTNEFHAVVVSHTEWTALGDEGVAALPGEAGEDFLFYWELPPHEEDTAGRLQRLREVPGVAGHWGGLVAPGASAGAVLDPYTGTTVTLLRLSATVELRTLRERLGHALNEAHARPLLVVVEASAASQLRQARDLALLLGGG